MASAVAQDTAMIVVDTRTIKLGGVWEETSISQSSTAKTFDLIVLQTDLTRLRLNFNEDGKGPRECEERRNMVRDILRAKANASESLSNVVVRKRFSDDPARNVVCEMRTGVAAKVNGYSGTLCLNGLWLEWRQMPSLPHEIWCNVIMPYTAKFWNVTLDFMYVHEHTFAVCRYGTYCTHPRGWSSSHRKLLQYFLAKFPRLFASFKVEGYEFDCKINGMHNNEMDLRSNGALYKITTRTKTTAELFVPILETTLKDYMARVLQCYMDLASKGSVHLPLQRELEVLSSSVTRNDFSHGNIWSISINVGFRNAFYPAIAKALKPGE